MTTSGDLVVVDLRPELEAAYEAFVSTHPAALIHYGLGFRALVSTFLGCTSRHQVALRSDQVVGVLPVMERDGPFGRVLNSLPFYGSHGGVLARDDDARAALCRRWNDMASERDVSAATMVTNPLDDQGALDALVHHQEIEPRIGSISPLHPAMATTDALVRSLRGDVRYDVRRASAAGVEVRVENDALVEVYEAHDAHMRSIGGRAKPWAFFELLGETLRPGADFQVYVGRISGDLAAVLLVLYAYGTAEYFTPATVQAHRSAQPGALLLAEAMADASARGCVRWNWGGSGRGHEGVLRFKRKWGSVDHPYRYLVRVNDQELRSVPPATIVASYPDFFVLPFPASADAGPGDR